MRFTRRVAAVSAPPLESSVSGRAAGALPNRRWNLRHSVRGKLFGVVFLTTIVVLVVAGTVMLLHDLSVYRKTWAADVASEANVLALSTAPALAFNDREGAARHLTALGTRASIMTAALYDAQGQLYSQFVREGEAAPPLRIEGARGSIRITGDQMQLTQAVWINEENVGTLYVRARYDIVRRFQSYLAIFSLIAALSLGAALILSALLQRWITVPLEEIGLVARQIVHGSDYSLRVRQTTTDEIGLAVQALNRMLDEVQVRKEALEQSNVSLRQQVLERQGAETALAKANARLESTMGAAEIGGWIMDLRTGELTVDRNFAALYGVEAPESFTVEPSLRWRAIHPDDVPAVAEAESHARDSGLVPSTEFRIVQPDGSLRWVLSRGRVQVDPQGRPAWLAGLLIDISAQKRAEQQRIETEKVYRAIGESIDFGVWIADPGGRCTYVSDSFLRLTGLTQEQCSSLGWAHVLHPDEVARTMADWRECAERGTTWYCEHRVLGVDGAYHPVLAQGVPIRDEDGVVRGWAGINLDISRMKSTEEALREIDRRKDEFLATLAHELRNPLAPVVHALRLLESPVATAAQQRWSREVIARQVGHMAMLLDDLLDVSRITRGRLELRTEIISLERVVAGAIETAQPLISEKEHHLTIDLSSAPVELIVDPLRMAQALSNLLLNAAKYTDARGEITLRAYRQGGGVAIAVADNGIGLPRDSLRAVFEMFSQVETTLARSQGGLGIGLALVKGLAQLHGGTVEAASPGLGRGSTFTLHLPESCVVRHRAVLPGSNVPRDQPVVAPQPGSRRRVLIADDNHDAADALSILLGMSGYEVSVAHSGQEAFELAAAQRPEFAILDIGMPGMSGYELASRLRAQTWGRDMLLIAVTGWGQSKDVAQAKQAGFDVHFTKPVDTSELERELARVGDAQISIESEQRR